MAVQTQKKKKSNLSIQEAAAKVFPVLQQKRTQSFITIALTFLALSLFGIFAINPTITTIIQLRKQLDDNKLVDQKLSQKIANLSVLQTKYDLLQNDLIFVLAAVPESHKLPLLLGQIQAIADKENVKTTQIQTTPLKVSLIPNGPGTGVSFSVDIEGTPTNIEHFITTLTSFSRIIVLDEVTVTNNNTGNQTLTQATIKGKAYYKTL